MKDIGKVEDSPMQQISLNISEMLYPEVYGCAFDVVNYFLCSVVSEINRVEATHSAQNSADA